MPSRRKVFTPNAEFRYYAKQVAAFRGYSTDEFAQQVAGTIYAAWAEIFKELYVALHNTDPFRTGVANTFPPAFKGVAIRCGNYILENYLLTGGHSYDGLLLHLTNNIPGELVARYLILLTVATAVKIPKVIPYLSTYQKPFYDAVMPIVSKVTGDLEEDKRLIDQFEDVARTYSLTPLSRSVAYYVATGLYKPPTGSDSTQGGETSSSPSIPPESASTSSQVSDIEKIIGNLLRYMRRPEG